jgi:hypothetical protein
MHQGILAGYRPKQTVRSIFVLDFVFWSLGFVWDF